MAENNLSGLFSDFNERKKKEQEEIDGKAAAKEAALVAASEFLNEVVHPEFQQAARQLIELGNQAKVEGTITGAATPSATLKFRIGSKQGAWSELTLKNQALDQYNVLATLEGRGASSGSFKGYHSSYAQSVVTPEWIQKLIPAFVAEVLKIN